jgi:hypothetical protein
VRRFCFACVLALVLLGCRESKKEGPGAETAPPPVAAADLGKLQEEESAVLSRRDALAREREKVVADRAALEEKRKQALAAGGEAVVAVETEERALVERENKLATDEKDLAAKLDALIANYQQAVAGSGGGDEVVRREARVATREKDFARREQQIASREATLAARERELAKRERETCSVGATTTIVQQVPAPESGRRYTRRDVEPVLARARRHMAEKGLLASDLPAPVRALETEATKAIGEGDYGKAKFAADQLLATVDALKIDKGFIAAKISRLNAVMKGKTVDGNARTQVDGLFRDATADYGDGKFAAANGKLNRIYGLIQ